MRAAMAAAEVGDDTFGEDPTVRALEERVADVLGVEAALYVSSGHMGNQVALRVHSQPGDSLIAHSGCHILNYESGAVCALSGVMPRGIDSADGTFTPQQLREKLWRDDVHHPRNRIVALENTHNRCGGSVWPLALHQQVCEYAHEHGLAVHLDGARLWNACEATGTSPRDWTGGVDSVSVCFSKGLGAPVGSCVAGSAEFVQEARFVRKMFGGQMRQAGIIAAGALYALEHNRARLAEDHANARLLAGIVEMSPHLSCWPPQTNMVMVNIEHPEISAARLAAELAAAVLAFDVAEKRIRCVTHLDVTRDDCQRAGEAFVATMQRLT